MSKERVHVSYDFAKPVDAVFDYLAEHENLAVVFGVKIRRVKDGSDGNRNGVGSVRELKMGPGLPPFEETTTVFQPHSLIEYEITKGSPLKAHHGAMVFSERPGGGSHLDYTIKFDMPLGLANVVGRVLKGKIVKGLATVDASA